jgi:prepilin-type N-terminal cleavage/methylation domain-containing protein
MRRAFTLLELLVCVAIVALLAALIFPVFSSAKDQARKVEEVSQLRQVYLAWQMYEDVNEEAAPSLASISRSELPPAVLLASRDPIHEPMFGRADFPADLFVDESPRRSPWRISFAYLRSFEGRFTGHSWADLRAVSSVGVLASTWGLKDTRCGYGGRKISEHGPVVDQGTLLRIRMDGGLKQIQRPWRGCGIGGSYEELFLEYR